MTRYEWMEMLCGQMGPTDHREEDPYFSDVDKGHNCFSYLQSAVEWEILKAGPIFHGEDRVSGYFIALAAMKAIGEQKLRICFELEEDMTEEGFNAEIDVESIVIGVQADLSFMEVDHAEVGVLSSPRSQVSQSSLRRRRRSNCSRERSRGRRAHVCGRTAFPGGRRRNILCSFVPGAAGRE